ncbi:hypothetical protein [Spirosoma flavum]|uniref:Uncharacterized protein n=1 Tax=Spirosoma flavum TaxID=2048557 RepID=A0ABW6ARX8_9BACT
MKKHTEKLPIDDLFARKLGNMSLPPSADGFERLQARMGQQKPDMQVVFWRNPAMPRYIAAAACLLVVCLFGWLYWPTDGTIEPSQEQVAANQPVISSPKKSARKQLDQQQNKVAPDIKMPALSGQEVNSDQVAITDKSSGRNKSYTGLASRPLASEETIKTVADEPVLAQTNPTKVETKTNTLLPGIVTPTGQATTEQVAETKTIAKSLPATERVLVVTIAEPQALIAARQAARASVEESAIVAQSDKLEKETKAGGLWQQVKRIKQGEIFARQDNAGNDDRGLLGRAYNGLKHSLDKDKSVKQ